MAASLFLCKNRYKQPFYTIEVDKRAKMWYNKMYDYDYLTDIK